MQHGDKILDVAVRYGYESPTAFNHAFKAVHGIAPSSVKKQGALIKAFPRVSFTVAVTGGMELSYFIEKNCVPAEQSLTAGYSRRKYSRSDDKWSYYIASATDKDTGHTFSSRIIPTFTWVVFLGEGTNRDIQLLEKRIVTECLPSSGYEYDTSPDVEVYLSPDPKHAKAVDD